MRSSRRPAQNLLLKRKSIQFMMSVAALLTAPSCKEAENTRTESTSDPISQVKVSLGLTGQAQAFVISSTIPADVAVPTSVTSPTDARPYFDIYSWQAFIALNWPATSTARGEPQAPNSPATFENATNGDPVVWGTYKEAFELFGQGSGRPSAWSSYDLASNPFGVPASQKILHMATKGGSLLGGVNESFSYPLVDQNLNYARFEVRFNQVEYDFIRGNNANQESWLYLVKNLASAQPISMPSQSIMVKASWRKLIEGKDDFDRYYWIEAQVYDNGAQKTVSQKMGLVGFHIAQKTKTFPQWIWSTFEQMDNVQRGPGASSETPISFNNGTDQPASPGGWANRPNYKAPDLLPKPQRVPVQITRLNPIPNTPNVSTRVINEAYQSLLKKTVWANYELVVTQWPSSPDQFKLPGNRGVYPQDCGGAFPEYDCVNTTMETYFQSRNDAAGAGGNSCMQCHYQAAKSDFSWVLQSRAY